MSSISSVALQERQLPDLHTGAATLTPPTTPAKRAEVFTAKDHPADKSYAEQLSLPSPARDYSYATFCPFTAGQYTEF